MRQDIDGIYSRMYRTMSDHKQGLISFHEMLQSWKEEARIVKEQHVKDADDKGKIDASKVA